MSPRQTRLNLDELADVEERRGPGEVQKAVDLFAEQCRARGLPPFEREHRFAQARYQKGWRFDFCWRDYKLAVEIEGLVFTRHAGRTFVTGRHATPTGIIEDMEKYNAAATLGWFVLRFPQKYVKAGHAIDGTVAFLASRGWVLM